ncbi:conserved hypothetical protein [Hyella patelloides LEGE 07179]|uniref:Zinc-ribbon domain-containing protein n=1 Tax=Hyella patelloides LEGE 07179 TaxID=945734 RepID=A0A563VY04_9CYAN|nr:zinc ribbon domain-containing protein [Hyella patelloides]VEP16299.1 conserved hypothetical protein [Hyella patelloides LEGE 07179]
MSYTVNLSSNQRLTVVNQGTQTLITLVSSSPGQQQSQSNSFTTGNWTSAPQLYKTGSGFILQLNSDRGKHHILIQGNSMSTTTTSSMQNAVQLDLESISDRTSSPNNVEFEPMQPMKPMKPMQPMKPMKMGDMSMDINQMSMQMGNMSLSMEKEQKSTSTKHFCTQCGQETKIGDRFCGSCGHKLDN